MKYLITFFIVALISVNAKGQIWIMADTVNHPSVIDEKLYENVVARGKDGTIFWAGLEEVKTCSAYKKFKKKFPEFIIPKGIKSRFKKCNP